jgi:hypothetical protein
MLGGQLSGIEFLPSVMYHTLSLTEQSLPLRSLFVLAVINIFYMYEKVRINKSY